MQIRVTDMNDNVPYFKDRVYTARVPENTDPGTVVITVIAEDKDEGQKKGVLSLLCNYLCLKCFCGLQSVDKTNCDTESWSPLNSLKSFNIFIAYFFYCL